MYNVQSIVTQFRRAIGEYMLVETSLAKADIGFVFGNIDTAEELAHHAASLYHRGYFDRVLLSGGTTKGEISEAERMCRVMLKRGVPLDAIILEDQAMNTGQNIELGMLRLDKTIGLENIKSVLAVGAIPASRRFLMAMEKQWPDVVKMFSTPNPYPVARDYWYADKEFKKVVLAEMHKIGDYEEKGFLQEIDLHKMNQKIAAL